MSEGQRQQQQYNSIESSLQIQSSQTTNQEESAGHRLSKRTARAGALVLQAYQGQKGGISPNKVLLHWTKELVSFCIPTPVHRKLFSVFTHAVTLS
jgi:hypothetical protein